MKPQGTNAEQVIDALSLEEHLKAFDIAAAYFRSSCAHSVGPALVPLLQPPVAEVDMHQSPHRPVHTPIR